MKKINHRMLIVREKSQLKLKYLWFGGKEFEIKFAGNREIRKNKCGIGERFSFLRKVGVRENLILRKKKTDFSCRVS